MQREETLLLEERDRLKARIKEIVYELCWIRHKVKVGMEVIDMWGERHTVARMTCHGNVKPTLFSNTQTKPIKDWKVVS